MQEAEQVQQVALELLSEHSMAWKQEVEQVVLGSQQLLLPVLGALLKQVLELRLVPMVLALAS